MSQAVEIPGLGIVEFPDSMTPEAIQAKAAELSRGRGGFLNDAMGIVRQAAGAVDPMGEMVTSGLRGERPALEGAAGTARFAAIPATANPLAQGAVAAGGEVMAQGFEQAMGDREGFDPGAAALAGSVPPAMAGVTKGAQAVAKRLPGAAATLHQMAKASLDRLSTIFGPTQSSDELYALVRQGNPHLAMPRLKARASALLDEEKLAEAGLELTGVAKTASSLGKRLETPPPGVNPGELPFDRAHLNLKRIGGKIRETRIEGGEEHGAWKALWKAGMDDLEAVAAAGAEGAPAVRALKQANAAARREYVSEEIADIFTKGGLTSRPDIGPDAFQVNFGRIADGLRKGKHADDIKGVLTKDEFKMLEQAISDLAKVTPNLPPPRGQFAGSAIKLGQTAAGGAAGYLAAPMLGMNPDTATAVGVIAGTKGVDILTRLLMSEHGRKLLGHFLSQSGGVVTQKMLSVLGLAAAQLPEIRGPVGDGMIQLGDLGRQAFQGTTP